MVRCHCTVGVRDGFLQLQRREPFADRRRRRPSSDPYAVYVGSHSRHNNVGLRAFPKSRSRVCEERKQARIANLLFVDNNR